MGSNWIEDTLGTDLAVYDEHSKPTGQFDLIPANTRVLARVESIAGRTNKNGKPYPAMVLTVVSTPGGLEGNFGHPKLYDNMNLTVPDAPARYLDQPEETRKKKAMAAGIWLRRVRALGLEPAKATGDLTETAVQAFFLSSLGNLVIVRVGVEPATDKYAAKNTVQDYEPVTDKAVERNKLTMPPAGSVEF